MLKRALFLTTLLASPVFAGPDAMTSEEARHLIARTGFGAAPHEIKAITGQSYRDGVASILAGLRTEPVTPMPSWTQDWAYPEEYIWTLGQTQTDLFYANRYRDLEELSAWWIGEMIATDSALTERLVLFWSDHFATSFEEHQNGQWSADQNTFFRVHAAGNFADLSHGILNDPSVLVYLDNVVNTKDAPNENLGREFLELFTLGEGRGYDQDDVRAAAAILTGYTVDDFGTPRAMLEADDHDFGPKTIFGKTANYGVDDLTPLVMENPKFGPYIVEKLWRTFVSDQPDPKEVARLTALWRVNDFEIKPLLKALFLTDAFWDPANRGRLVKSPIEMVAGTSRSLGLSLPNGTDYAWLLEDLGQMPFLPPNVGGWPEGVEWINDATASGRATILTYILYEAGEQAAQERSPQQPLTIATETAPNDLRVGQVFIPYVEERDPGFGYGAQIVLYDVGYQGQNWRSLTMWMEYDDEENATGLYIFTGDCDGGCLGSMPQDDDEPGWVSVELWDGWLEDHPQLNDDDLALLQSLGGNLPDLIAGASDQLTFQYDPDDPTAEPADISRLIHAADVFRSSIADAIGQHNGQLVRAYSRANPLGVSSYGMSKMNPDSAIEAREEATIIPLTPSVTYQTSRDWLNALPGTGLESEKAAAALLAVSRGAQGQRDELIATDPDALIRSLILSPAYQVK